MSERPDDRGRLTPGDPLGDGEDDPPPRGDAPPPPPRGDAPPPPPGEPAPPASRRDAGPLGIPERPPPRSEAPTARHPGSAGEAIPGYGPHSPAPPGAGGPARTAGAGLPGQPGQYVLSGWWRRAGAAIIDGLILTVAAVAVLAVFGAVFSVGFFAGDTVGVVSVIVGLLLATVAYTIVALLYAPLLMSRTNGRTLGRMVTGIRVIRANGHPMTFGFAMLREVAVKALLFGIASSLTFGLASLLDILWPLWDEENRALHDILVDTRVIIA
jgi:uncharacterized RDD family membrane protein YckC